MSEVVHTPILPFVTYTVPKKPYAPPMYAFVTYTVPKKPYAPPMYAFVTYADNVKPDPDPTPKPDPDPDPVLPGEGIYAYFAAPVGWTTVDAWVWDAKNGNANYTGGSWPGVSCVKTGETYQGKEVWLWKYNGTLTTLPTHIIFNNGNSGDGNQTQDLLFQNGKCYDFNGLNSDIVITGVKGISGDTTSGKVKIFNVNGVKVAEVAHMEDAEYILAPGVYVAGGKKFVIK